jgi:hypothetical protein
MTEVNRLTSVKSLIGTRGHPAEEERSISDIQGPAR